MGLAFGAALILTAAVLTVFGWGAGYAAWPTDDGPLLVPVVLAGLCRERTLGAVRADVSTAEAARARIRSRVRLSASPELTADENELLKLFERWRAEAEKAGHKINRIAVDFEAGRDGFSSPAG